MQNDFSAVSSTSTEKEILQRTCRFEMKSARKEVVGAMWLVRGQVVAQKKAAKSMAAFFLAVQKLTGRYSKAPILAACGALVGMACLANKSSGM